MEDNFSTKDIIKLLDITIGLPHDEHYISAQDFMTHEFSGRDYDMSMSRALQQQIHELEKQAFGTTIKAYPETTSMRLWIERLLKTIATQRAT